MDNRSRIDPSKCGGCKNSVVKCGAKCKICTKMFHRSCAQKMKRCCDEEITFVNISIKSSEDDILESVNNIEITGNSSHQDLLLKIIHELESKNRLLEENTVLLKYKISVLENVISIKDKICSRCDKENDNIHVNQDVVADSDITHAANPIIKDNISSGDSLKTSNSTNTGCPQRQREKITLHEMNIAVADAEGKIKSSINNTSSGSKINEWRTVPPRKSSRRNRSALVVGRSAESSTVLGIEKKRALHVSRLRPDTSTDDLKAFLNKNFPSVECEKIQSRYPESYASFKVLIPITEFDKVKNADNWPKNASVNYFFLNRNRKYKDIMNPIHSE
ncbi:uncharacterized protein LOC123670871 [Harmonia axyridis]|uniref:uncharacterized protein LOC123670871 n=1 Tax=Harmonia axyridis TaxID=115357 RepID=UPI001E274F33|nr:uncharacterized protein LOC123670871 [Harmonia axyridis]